MTSPVTDVASNSMTRRKKGDAPTTYARVETRVSFLCVCQNVCEWARFWMVRQTKNQSAFEKNYAMNAPENANYLSISTIHGAKKCTQGGERTVGVVIFMVVIQN
jgi:epoxyqueuosine reductase QueG